jgi:hypothetical protein
MAALTPTPVLREATLVGALSAFQNRSAPDVGTTASAERARLAGTTPRGRVCATPARPHCRSELALLRERQGIIDFDPEVTDGALDLGMSEEQLDRSQIAGRTVDLRRLGTAHRMRAIGAAVHPGTLDPALYDAGVLAGCPMRLIVDSARKNVGASIDRSQVQPVLQRCARLLGDLELHRTASLVLDNCGPVSHVTTCADVIDPKADKVAAPELAVDVEVEQREIACAVLDLKSDTNGPDLFRPQGTLCPTRRPLFHGAHE